MLGRSAVRVVAGGDFAARWASHREWVAREMLGPPLPFPAGAETRELAKLLRERYDLMARSGLVRFLGNDQARWRYTPAGALRVTLGNLWANVAKRRFTRTRTASGRGPGGP